MDRFTSRYATPLTTGLFVVSTLSGLALFFHWQPAVFHGMHEWLSLVLLAPFALHMVRNWRPLLAYARNGTLVLALAICALISAPFAVGGLTGSGEGGNPAMRTMRLMTLTPLDDLAPVLKTTPEALRATLAAHGHPVGAGDDTLAAIATSSGSSATDLLVMLLPAPRGN